MTYVVPFNQVSIVGRELELVSAAARSGRLSGNGPFTRRAEEWLEEHCGASRVLLTPSGTAALEMVALLCDLQPGDEVLMPSFTFVSTANAFVLRGARPRFVDIRADTLNIDESLLEQAVGPRTRAVVAVHYAGVACAMDVVLEVARRHQLLVVEDAAHALGSTFDGVPLGALGSLGVWSFHETKNVTCGEGGALVLSDRRFVARAEILRDKGTDRARFLRGEVDKYTWVDVGSSFVPSELAAAFLLGQLEREEAIRHRRLEIWERYRAALADLEAEGLVRLPTVPPRCTPNGHLFYLLLTTEEKRDALIAALAESGVQAVFHYVPLHDTEIGRRLGSAGDLPITESVSRRLVRLPCYFGLRDEEQDLVIAATRSFLLQSPRRRTGVASAAP
jgi:dTDP-4-amino-4,6-dideoxygalactose transaminase